MPTPDPPPKRPSKPSRKPSGTPTPPPRSSEPPKQPAEPQPSESQPQEGFPSLENIALQHQQTARRPAKKPLWTSPALIAGVLFGIAAGAGLAYWLSLASSAPLLPPLANQSVDELATLEFDVAPDAAALEAPWQYRLVGAPAGAAIDPATGRFSWRPTEEQGPGWYEMTVEVTRYDAGQAAAVQPLAISVNEVNRPPVLAEIGDQSLELGRSLTLQAEGSDPDAPSQSIIYQLGPGAPEGAAIDSKSGQLSFTPENPSVRQEFRIIVRVREAVPDGLFAEQSFRVRIAAPANPVEQLRADLQRDGAEVVQSAESLSNPFSVQGVALSVDRELIGVFAYDTPEAAQQDLAKATPESLAAYDRSGEGKMPVHVFRKDQLLVLYGGGNPTILGRLTSQLGKPVVSSKAKPVEAAPKPEPKPTPVAESTPEPEALTLAAKLHDEHKLFRLTEYGGLRHVFASRFASENNETIRTALGEDADAMLAWLDEHEDLRDELYTAIRPEDDIAMTMILINALRKEFPDQLGSYGDLAIAIAVTWDRVETGVYDYTFHAKRTRSKLPESAPLNAVENFRYMLTAEKYMQGRERFLPWEFLVHIVNHTTPLDERAWAVRTYFPRHTMIGKCYGDVPYDTEMLASGGQFTKLDGQDYTLENIAKYGGVCSMQADYAARVAKSLGVPAESVSGESRYGESHAWVMWVEIQGVSKLSITFSLESFGRYRDDMYYVGTLRDPQTGKKITDRQLELRLHTVGMSPKAKRHAEHIMAIYPLLREKEKMDVSAQLAFLNRVIELSPGNEEAWKALAQMSRDGVVTVKQNKAMLVTLDKLFRTFAAFPDFTWEVFDDLVAYQEVRQQKTKLYNQLIVLYEQAQRPDLACEARLKFADYLVEQEQSEPAIQGLAAAIKRFPEEGRYVPKMLDKLEEICATVDGANEKLLGFYREFLPMIPQRRGSRPSAYCVEMYKRAIERFRAGKQDQMARLYEAQLTALTGEKP